METLAGKARPVRLARRALTLVCTVLVLLPALAPAAGSLNDDLASMILSRLFLLDLDVERKTGGKLIIAVIGSQSVYEAFSRLRGQPLQTGSSIVVSEVSHYERLHEGLGHPRPTVVFAGASADPDQITTYTRTHGILSATNVPEYAERGITLSVTAYKNKPRVTLNTVASDLEGISWNPKLRKIAHLIP